MPLMIIDYDEHVISSTYVPERARRCEDCCFTPPLLIRADADIELRYAMLRRATPLMPLPREIYRRERDMSAPGDSSATLR